jgi:hypothetical protein
MEKLARRYGQDAVALSGPCAGKKIYDCVCKSLQRAGAYSGDLANKVAGIWIDKKASEECLEDYVREGFELKQASLICEALKAKYAQFDDMVTDRKSVV